MMKIIRDLTKRVVVVVVVILVVVVVVVVIYIYIYDRYSSCIPVVLFIHLVVYS